MLLQSLFLVPTLLSSLVASVPGNHHKLPLCGPIERPCRCPSGTTFKNLTTFGIIGAPAVHIEKIMGSFFDISYMHGLAPISTTGTDRKPGATRTFNLTGPAGSYLISEVLTKYKVAADGSWFQQFGQSPKPPSVQIPGGGTYHGQWHTFTGDQTKIANETVLTWKNWRCEVGDTFPAAIGHEEAITNVSSILRKQGLNTGVDVQSFSIFYEIRDEP